MNRMTKTLAVATLVAAMLAPAAWAQMRQNQNQNQNQFRNQDLDQWQEDYQKSQQRADQQYKGKLCRASKLIGHDVKLQGSDQDGEIQEIVLNPDSKRIDFAVMSTGTWYEADDHFAVPFQMLDIQKKGDEEMSVKLNARKTELQNAPRFKKDQPKDFTDPEWSAEHDRMWRQSTADTRGLTNNLSRRHAVEDRSWNRDLNRDKDDAEEVQDRNSRRDNNKQMANRDKQRRIKQIDWEDKDYANRRLLSEVIGMDVATEDNDDFGTVEDVLLETQSRRPAYLLVSFEESTDAGNMAVVPFSAARFRQGEKQTVHVRSDARTVKQFSFEEGNLPKNLEDTFYGRKVHDAYQEDPYWIAYHIIAIEVPEQSSQAWDKSSREAVRYSAGSEEKIEGKIQSIGTYRPSAGAESGRRLVLKTDDNNYYTVHAGPASYIRSQDIDLENGQEVTVTGSLEKKRGYRDTSVARQIKTDDGTLTLRSEQGQPKWDTQKMETHRKEEQKRMEQQRQRNIRDWQRGDSSELNQDRNDGDWQRVEDADQEQDEVDQDDRVDQDENENELDDTRLDRLDRNPNRVPDRAN